MEQLSPNTLKLIGSNSDKFLNAVQNVSSYLGILPEWLLTCMYMESRFNPKAVNTSTKATGLIQFMPATAPALGTSTDSLYTMDNVTQMLYVQKYLSAYKGKMKSLSDVYLAIFYPTAIGKPNSFVIGSEKSKEFAQKVEAVNKVYDLNKDGVITKGEISAYIESLYFEIFPSQKKKLFKRFLMNLFKLKKK